MKTKLTLGALVMCASVFGQTNLWTLGKKVLDQTPNQLELQNGKELIVLDHFSIETYKEDYVVGNSFPNSSSEYSIIKRGNNISGFIYYSNKSTGYLIETKKGQVIFKEVPANEILFTCSFTEEEKQFNEQEIALEQVYPETYFIGNYATETDILKLQSRPGAQYLLYLDFDGEPTLKGWESQGFVATAVTNMPNGLKQRIWESVAADFIPFDVNVTTDRAVFDAHPTINKGWAVCADFGTPSWYGVAFRPSFGTGKPALIDLPTSWGGNINYLFRTPSHELGHTLSLSHDGNNLNGDGEYYKGHGEYTPIMGSGNRLVTHWSIGEYSGATNKEDDISIIHGYLGYASDDHSGTRAITFSGESINSIDNHGIIENPQDEDVWSFEMTGPGDVNITIDPVLVLTDLDVHVELKNSWGTTVFEDNPVGKREVVINQSLDLGTYYLHITSGAELTSNTGWSAYGVFGYYDIYGSVENVVRETNDIIVSGITGLDNICSTSETLTPQVEIINGGTDPITDMVMKVYIDDVLTETQNISTYLSIDQSETFSLQTISEQGSHTYKVVVEDGNGVETKIDNNTAQGDYSYVNGEVFSFNTDMPFYSGETGFVWEVESTTGGTGPFNSGDVSIQALGGNSSQSFCLETDNCYSFTFSGAIDYCVGNDRWSTSEVYTSGDQCSYGGFYWEAQWWTQGEAPPASVWKKLGACESGPYNINVKQVSTDEEQFGFSSNDYVTGNSEELCIGQITSVVNFKGFNELTLYPNPIHEEFNIVFDGEGKLSVFTLNGELVENKSHTGFTVVNSSSWAKGAYIIKLETKEKTLLGRIVK